MVTQKSRPEPSQIVALLPGGDVEALAETLVAFANADGGTLYVGVAENGQLTGEIFPEEFNAVVHQAECLCRPPIPVDWRQMEAGAAFIFAGQVQRSPELHALADGRVLVRTGTENRPLSGDQIRQLATTRSAGDYEAEVIPGATRQDLDADLLAEFVQKWEERQGRPLTRPREELLQEYGWLTATGQPTIAGILLLGRNPQMFVPRSGLTFVRFEGTEMRGAGGEPGYGRRVEVRGPLPRIIRRTWEIIQEEIQVGAVVRSLEREENWAYPPTAIREALVNAVAHRDYRLRGRAIEVRVFDDRLEISSPGGLPGFVTVDNIVDEHFSRNPRVVSGLYQWGYIEELGLGVDLMIEEMVGAGHEPPQFRDTPFSFTVTFQAARQPWLRHRRRLSTNERQVKALDYIQKHEQITNGEYQELCPNVSSETLRLDLVDLVAKGVLLKIGAKRGTYYILK
ncbi:MAG: ATP-binding protein [Chloroflexota bacterium]|nr:ATP-binding protein [Chloroflexota bacterium]